jgi:hypothetical protein
MERICELDGCDRRRFAHGYCRWHWQQLVFLPSRPPCEELGCERPRLHARFCRRHHDQKRRAVERASKREQVVGRGISRYGDRRNVVHLALEDGTSLCGRALRRLPPRAVDWPTCTVCDPGLPGEVLAGGDGSAPPAV